MRAVFICQVLDYKDPIQATTIRWISVLAQKPQVEAVHVVSLRSGDYVLPANVKVHSLQAKNKFIRLLRFYRQILSIVRKGRIDFFFIYQGGPYPLLLLPFKHLGRIPVYQWKAHPYISQLMKFYALCCNSKIFTSTRNAFPLQSSKVYPLGQGVNTESFCISNTARGMDLLTVGRVVPSKRIDLMLRVLAELKHEYSLQLQLSVIGPIKQEDGYFQHLYGLLQELGLQEQVKFPGALEQHLLPRELNRHKLFLNFSITALDRAVVEAMACGLPVFSVNPCVEEIMPGEYKPLLYTQNTDVAHLAAKIHAFFQLQEEERIRMGQKLREVVVREHSDVSLFDKLLAEIQ